MNVRGPRFGGALCVSACIALAACGGGEEEATSTAAAPSEEAVAVVDGVEDGVIGRGELNNAVAAAALRRGEESPPSPQAPEYSLYAGDALDDLVLARWLRGEASERGLDLADAGTQAVLEEAGGVNDLRRKWEARTRCAPGYSSRLCDSGAEEAPPPDIPPASG